MKLGIFTLLLLLVVLVRDRQCDPINDTAVGGSVIEKNESAVPQKVFKEAEKGIADLINIYKDKIKSTTDSNAEGGVVVENVPADATQVFKETEKGITDFINTYLTQIEPAKEIAAEVEAVKNDSIVPEDALKEAAEKGLTNFINAYRARIGSSNGTDLESSVIAENVSAVPEHVFKEAEKGITNFINAHRTKIGSTNQTAVEGGVNSENASEVPKQTPRDDKKKIMDSGNTFRANFQHANNSAVVGGAIVENVSALPKQTYKEAEKEITDFVNSMLRSILPKVIGGSGSARLSPRCTAGMMKVFGNIRRMRGWTLKMLDSMGKPSSGILKGTAYSMGNYDECLDLSVTNKGSESKDSKDELFRGKYCRVKIRFPEIVIETARNYHKGKVNESELGRLKDIMQVIPYIPVKSNYMNHFLGMCFPSTCTLDDLQQLVKLIPFPGTASVDRCEVKTESEVDNVQLIIICLFLILVLFVVISTAIHWLFHSKEDGKYNGGNNKKCFSITISFSMCNNTKRLMRSIEDDTEGLLGGQSVRGIIVASVACIIVGHTYLFPFQEYYFQMSSLENLRNYWNEGYFTMFMSFPLAFDALFVCYGFLFTFTLWQPALKSHDIKINIVSLIVNNYIWLCLPLLLCYGLVLLLPLFGSGPFWGDLLQGAAERCRANAGAHFGMFSNFLELEKQCFPHFWFVSCLAQLTLVGIFLSWILSRSLKVGVLITLLICIACNGAVGVLTVKNDLPPSYVAYFMDEASNLFWKINMALPLSHFGPYAAGMLSGILIARKENHRTRTCLGTIGWIACLGILYALQVGLYNSRDGSISRIWSGLFASMHRTAFGLCVSWVIVACSFGIGGFVNAILSCRIFDPLFRLSYYAYLFHFIIISFIVSLARDHSSYNHLELILRASSYIAATYFMVYFFYMILEMPLLSLKEALFPKRTCQIDVTPLNNFKSHKGDIISKSASIEGSCKLWSITESHNGISY